MKRYGITQEVVSFLEVSNYETIKIKGTDVIQFEKSKGGYDTIRTIQGLLYVLLELGYAGIISREPITNLDGQFYIQKQKEEI